MQSESTKKMDYGLQSVMLLMLLCVPVWCSQLLYVYIDADSGKDNTGCLNSNSTSKPCQSLPFVVEYLTRTNSVRIEIKSQQLNLTRPVEFNVTYNHLTLSGSGNTTISCNASGAGLAFMNVKNLTIFSVTIEHCGALRESTTISQRPDKTEHLSVAIYLLNCTDVSIWHVDIQSSNGTGVSLYDVNGTVNIQYCNFINNNAYKMKGGSGLHIEFTICSPGVVATCSDHKQRNHYSKYTIQNCTFVGNVAHSPLSEQNFLLPSVNASVPRVGKGGGIYISIGADAAENTFTITGCHIVNNSANFAAGGMLVELLNSVQKNNISIYETVLKKNVCPKRYAGNGGGLIVDFMFYSQSYYHGILPNGNSFLCYNCIIERNSAYRGGGTSIFVTKGINTTQFENSIMFLYCKWTENVSPLGSAVYISPGLWDYTLQGFLPVPVFLDCTFESNSVVQTLYNPSHASNNVLNATSLGYGAIFVSELHIRFAGRSHFTGNKGSAVYLSSSVLEFDKDSNVIFYNNTGHNGGAIAMYGSSAIYINNGSAFNFTNNTASLMGGAIYSETAVVLQLSYYNCFIQSALLENFKTNSIFSFNGNVAKNGGSIFATTFRSCRIFCPQHNASTTIYPQEILQCIANFTFSESISNASIIATGPDNFALKEKAPVLIIPGSEYTLQLSVTDEANNSLSGIVYEAGVSSTENVSIDPAFYQVSNNVINIYGKVGNKAELHLDTYDVTLSFNITLTDCKPGYIPNKWTCECAASEYLGLEACIPNVLLTHGFWIGFCTKNDSTLCTGYCPYGFCSYHKMKPTSMAHPLPNDSRELDYEICGPSRTGRLCGTCADNYSVYFHSSKYTCGSEGLCHLGWLFYLISEVLPIAIFFIIILVLNIRFTKGNVNGFIFYAQILDALATNGSGSIHSPYFINLIRNILTLFYRPFNLDFFCLEQLSFCLWKGASVMDVLIMKYVAVGFALVLVVLTILLARSRCRNYHFFARFYTPNSFLIHGLSAFFILCYSQCAQITFHILTYFCLYSIDLKCEEKVVNGIGSMNYFQGDHIKYALFAIFVLIAMIIIPPFLLLIYPLLFKLLGFCKVSESKLAGILWRMMPIQLLDTFQSSFKDNLRFFAGLYFLYRAIILAVYAYSPTLLLFYSIVQLQLIMILVLHSIFQPYKEKRHNIIDSLLFANLAIINGITLYNFAEREKDAVKRIVVMTSIQTVLILLPFLCAAASVGYQLITMYKKRKLDDDDDDLPSLRSGTVESVSLLRN